VARAAKKRPASKKRTVKKKGVQKAPFRPVRAALKWAGRGAAVCLALMFLATVIYAFVNPPTTPYILSEARRLGDVDHQWVDIEDIAPVMARSVVAAEDANYCYHWGFDMAAIREALEDGGQRGASTISQQVVKNAYLWQGRNWLRKALEAVMTPLVEAVWTKRRILEVYLNVAEFGEGVFGIEAAAQNYFKVRPKGLNSTQAARLAALLPNPKDRRPRGRLRLFGAGQIRSPMVPRQ